MLAMKNVLQTLKKAKGGKKDNSKKKGIVGRTMDRIKSKYRSMRD